MRILERLCSTHSSVNLQERRALGAIWIHLDNLVVGSIFMTVHWYFSMGVGVLCLPPVLLLQKGTGLNSGTRSKAWFIASVFWLQINGSNNDGFLFVDQSMSYVTAEQLIAIQTCWVPYPSLDHLKLCYPRPHGEKHTKQWQSLMAILGFHAVGH